MADLRIKDLKEASYNPRTITDKRLGKLKKSIRQFGDLSGVVFNKRTGALVSGHQRLKTVRDEKTRIDTKKYEDKYGTVEIGYIYVAASTGEIAIPLRIVDWSDKKTEMAANLAANAQGGEFDKVKLKAVVAKLETGNFDIELTGLETSEIRTLRDLDISKFEGNTGAPEAPAAKTKEQPTVKETDTGYVIEVTAKNSKHLR